ncbi:Hypothetical predicted protein [Lecanosticta acicola]|uniref:Uncharacterized protein n=1 Tax=Lecanosticta acicola TaxID=111012 RepID=A0AAI9E9G5_9PEZI|nr:Hypothetical predicted protein [Lecanosticta acicola]
MAEVINDDRAVGRARAITENFLKQQFPLLPTESLRQAARKCGEIIDKDVQSEEDARGKTTLLSIPIELRNRIFALSLRASETQSTDQESVEDDLYYRNCGERTVVLYVAGSFKIRYYENFSPLDQAPYMTEPPLTQVCKELRSESLAVWYAINKFTLFCKAVPGRDLWYHPVMKQTHIWLLTIGREKAEKIRDLVFFFPKMRNADNWYSTEEVRRVIGADALGLAKTAVKVVNGKIYNQMVKEGKQLEDMALR